MKYSIVLLFARCSCSVTLRTVLPFLRFLYVLFAGLVALLVYKINTLYK